MTDGERRARLVLTQVVEPGDSDACRLVRDFSAVELVSRLRAGDLPSPKAAHWAERLRAVDVDGLVRAADRVSARYIVPTDDEWPVALADLGMLAASDQRAGEPFGLWVRGPLRLGHVAGEAVAVVGARASTDYGDHVSGAIAAGCAARGHPVVSGGAYGIDAASHRGALSVDGHTVAVLASGSTGCTPSLTPSCSRRSPRRACSSARPGRAARPASRGSWCATASSPHSAAAPSWWRPPCAVARSTRPAGRATSAGW